MAEDDDLPRDAKLVKTILTSMGVQDYEPRVVHQFLDFWYRYVVEVLGDAQVYSAHAGKSVIDCEDVKLAIQSRVNFSFSQPPPRETLLELARIRNSIPLPKAISGPGIALPPEQDTLIALNYQLAVPTRSGNQIEEEMEVDDDGENQQIPSTTDKSGVPVPISQNAEFDGTRKVTFSLAAKRPRTQ